MKIQEVVIVGQGSAQLQEREHDTTLGELDVLIQSERSFISAGTELSIYTGVDSDVHRPGAWCEYPFRAGYANVGRVIEAGPKVDRFAVGDRVFSFGPHASHHVRSTTGDVLTAAVAEDLPVNETVASRMAHVAMTAIDVASPGHHRYVVVFGLGAVGNLAAQLFQLTGATVIGVDPSPHRRELALNCGVAYAIGGSEDEVKTQVGEITRGRMAKVTVDAVGHSAVSLQCVSLTAGYGDVIILGTPRAPLEGDLTHVFGPAHRKMITIRGALEWRVPIYPQLSNEHSQLGKHEAIMTWIGDGRLKIAPLISHVLPPTAIVQAYEGLLNRKDEYLGVVLDWGGAGS